MTLEELIQKMRGGEQLTLIEVADVLEISTHEAIRLIMVANKTGIIELGENTSETCDGDSIFTWVDSS